MVEGEFGGQTHANGTGTVKIGFLNAEKDRKTQIGEHNVGGMDEEEKGKNGGKWTTGSPKDGGIGGREGDEGDEQIDEFQGNAEKAGMHQNCKM